MRITVIVAKLNLNGGGENHDIFTKVKSLSEKGHEVLVVTIFSDKNSFSSNIPFRVAEEFCKQSSFLGLQSFVYRILKKYSAGADILYVVGSAFIFGAAWYRLNNRHKQPVVADINGYADFVEDYYKQEPLYPVSSLSYKRGLLKNIKFKFRVFLQMIIGVPLINCLDKIIFISKATAEYYYRAGIKKEKSTVVAGFHDLALLRTRPKGVNPYTSYPTGTFHILSTGRLHIDKGFDILIKAFMSCRCPQAILHIVGDGPEKANLEKLVQDYNLEDRVKIHPWQTGNNLFAYYQYADLFVYSARLPEVMVRVTVEAMAFGLPLVVADTSVESWIAQEVAKVFKNGNIKDLQKKIEEAYTDKDWQKHAHLAAERRTRDFDCQYLVLQLEAVLSEICKQTPLG